MNEHNILLSLRLLYRNVPSITRRLIGHLRKTNLLSSYLLTYLSIFLRNPDRIFTLISNPQATFLKCSSIYLSYGGRSLEWSENGDDGGRDGDWKWGEGT